MILAAWDEMKTETIANCFCKAGWKKDNSLPLPVAEEDEEDIPLSVLRERPQLPNSMTFEDYSDVDAILQTDEEITDLLSENRPGEPRRRRRRKKRN